MATKVRRHLSEHFFFYALALFVIITSIAAYYRFMVDYDYVVSYEGKCEPSLNSCFTGCEDEECSVVYYYSIVHKYAHDLHEQCGKDITDCEEANICLEGERGCSVTYCEAELDGEMCSVINEYMSEPNDESPGGEDELLESNNQDI